MTDFFCHFLLFLYEFIQEIFRNYHFLKPLNFFIKLVKNTTKKTSLTTGFLISIWSNYYSDSFSFKEFL